MNEVEMIPLKKIERSRWHLSAAPKFLIRGGVYTFAGFFLFWMSLQIPMDKLTSPSGILGTVAAIGGFIIIIFGVIFLRLGYDLKKTEDKINEN
jgi:hypothetical protein